MVCEEVQRWTPVLNGNIYCSPGCGFDCLKSHYEIAVKKANTLAGRLGPGWEAIVWENGGWHYSAKKGFCDVHAHEDRSGGRETFDEESGYRVHAYTAYFNVPDHQFVATASSPEDALGYVTQDAQTALAKIRNALQDLID